MAVAIANIVRNMKKALEPLSGVREVTLIGSRARGDAGPLSDWDFAVITDDFESIAAKIDRATAHLEPLAGQWDRLSPHMCYMLILPGGVKVDFLFLDQPHELKPPWEASAETLPGIDAHFWDWAIWLAAKETGGKRELVAEELRKLYEHLLSPMGVTVVPANVTAAVELYIEARERLEEEFGVRVQRDLERHVRSLLQENGYPI